ncbi:Serine/arginine-rich splicing factor SR45a, partial [Linum perenne]
REESRSRSRSKSRSRSRVEAVNPGNTLYVTGLSTRVTERELEDHFSKEGKVASCFLVVEPRTRISRGFAFVTMDNVDDANRCVKYLNQSILEGRYITVEKVVLRTVLCQLCWQQSVHPCQLSETA